MAKIDIDKFFEFWRGMPDISEHESHLINCAVEAQGYQFDDRGKIVSIKPEFKPTVSWDHKKGILSFDNLSHEQTAELRKALLGEPNQELTHSEVTKKSDQELTEFEAAVSLLLISGYKSSVMTEGIAKNDAKKLAPSLLSIARKQFIEEACEWLSEKARYYFFGMAPLPNGKFIEDFRRALEKGKNND